MLILCSKNFTDINNLLLYLPLEYIYIILKKSDKYGKNLSKITSNIGKWTSGIFNNLKVPKIY